MGKRKKGNNRLPYGLCLKNGIEIQDGWTPTDCWNALYKHTGKSVFEILQELKREEIEELEKTEVFKKDNFHPHEITSLVNDKISSNRKKLEKYGFVYTQVTKLIQSF